MKAHSKEFDLEKMAQVLGVCRSGYYEFLKRLPSQRAMENEELLKKLKKIHKESRETYGSPRIYQELKKQGEKCSRIRKERLPHNPVKKQK